jgi:quercetin 2,3-dioxygenase
MITIRKAAERERVRHRNQENWCAFDAGNTANPFGPGFGALESLHEIRLAPGAGVPRSSLHAAEVVTYVHQGVLTYEDSLGHLEVVQAGEFQRVTPGPFFRHSKTNASRSAWAHVYQVALRPSEDEPEPRCEQKRFCVADRRNRLCVVASLDARRGSLRVHQDAVLYSCLLDPGQHLVHQLPPGRNAWLYLVRGEVSLDDRVLRAGDGSALTAEPAVSLTASEETEILLVEVGEPVPRFAANGDGEAG